MFRQLHNDDAAIDQCIAEEIQFHFWTTTDEKPGKYKYMLYKNIERDTGAYRGVRGRLAAGGGHTQCREGRQTGQALCSRVVQSWCEGDWSQTSATLVIEGSRSTVVNDRPSLSETETLAGDRWSHQWAIPTASAWDLLLSHTKRRLEDRTACWMATKLCLLFFYILEHLRFVHVASKFGEKMK